MFTFLLLDQTPLYEEQCYFTSWVSWVAIISLLWHLNFFIFPYSGNWSYVKSMFKTEWPYSCFLLMNSTFGSVIASYYSFWGGCPQLRDISFMGLLFTDVLYLMAMWKRESGRCDLFWK